MFLTAWNNPRPQVKVVSIDIVSARQVAAPFCLAITAEVSDATPASPASEQSRAAQLTKKLARVHDEIEEQRQSEIQVLTEQIQSVRQELEKLRKDFEANRPKEPVKP